MTGLYNRKILTPALEQRLQQLVNTGTLVTFIAIDCDKLKVINDTLGHKGDRIITHLAKAIQALFAKATTPSASAAMILLSSSTTPVI